MFGTNTDSLTILTGQTELGRTVVIHMSGPLAAQMFDQLFEHGWALGFEDGVIYFAPAWATDNPLEIHTSLPWEPEVWGVQDDTRWMSLKDGDGEDDDLRHGEGNLLYPPASAQLAEA